MIKDMVEDADLYEPFREAPTPQKSWDLKHFNPLIYLIKIVSTIFEIFKKKKSN